MFEGHFAMLSNAMVTNHLRAPYGVYFAKHRTIIRRPYGARPAAGKIVRFLINFLDIVRCPDGHRTMSDKRHELSKISKQIDRCPLGHRTMPVRAPADVLWVELPPMRSDVFFAEVHIAFTYFTSEVQKHKYVQNYIIYSISFKQLRRINMQPKSAFEIFAVLSKCGFLLYHCQSQPQSFLS